MNNDLANWLRDFANANEDSFESDQIRNLLDAAAEIRDLRETVNDLSGWVAGVEADNDTLRNEIRRLREELEEARNEADDLGRETWDHGGALGQFERENDDA